MKISFGELFIYAGINRGIELKYLNPFTPSFIKDINTSDFEIGDNYNSIIFTTFNWVFNDEIKFFGEFIVDDFQIDDTGRDNKLGYKIGSSLVKNDKYNFLYEYVNIGKSTYIHHGEFTSYYNNERLNWVINMVQIQFLIIYHLTII